MSEQDKPPGGDPKINFKDPQNKSVSDSSSSSGSDSSSSGISADESFNNSKKVVKK